MKKFITILSILLLFSINPMPAVAETKTYSQGFYTMKDLGLSEGVSYTAQNTSLTSRALIFILDENQKIQQLLRLAPFSSSQYKLTPLKSSFHFIIYGDDVQIAFS